MLIKNFKKGKQLFQAEQIMLCANGVKTNRGSNSLHYVDSLLHAVQVEKETIEMTCYDKEGKEQIML